MALTHLVTDPETYIEEKLTDRGLRWEFIAVLLVGLIGFAGTMYAGLQVLENMPTETSFSRFQVFGLAARPLFGMFVLWFGSAIAVHVIASRVYGGRGPIRRLLKTSAWAFTPLAIGNLVRSVAIYFTVQAAEFPDPSSREILAQIKELFAEATTGPLMTVATVVLLLTAVYSGYLLSSAVRHSKGISEDDARKTAAVPVGAFVLFVVWNAI